MEEADIIQAFQNYGYIALFFILALGGPPAALVAGLLASQDFFSPWIIWPIAIAADLVADIFWYSLGRFGRERAYTFIKNFFSVADRAVQNAERLFLVHGTKIIFFSKATMGLGFLGQFMLTLQGFLKIPFRFFILYNFLGGVILSGAVAFGGYYFGLFWSHTSRNIRIAIFIAFIAAIVIIWKSARRMAAFTWLRLGSNMFSPAESDSK